MASPASRGRMWASVVATDTDAADISKVKDCGVDGGTKTPAGITMARPCASRRANDDGGVEESSCATSLDSVWQRPSRRGSLDEATILAAVEDDDEDAKEFLSEDVLGESVDKMLSCIMPTEETILKRIRIVSYLSSLIVETFPAECAIRVIPFGSVPLRAYLPDGDIDIGIFCCGAQLQPSWLYVLQAALKHAGEKWGLVRGNFRIHGVNIVEAEVRVCKCIVDDIEVDISLNMPGGVRTMAFLERIDTIIGNSHLYKRSLILLKAWCYYESRILGGHISLISTYALNIMVLFIINKYNKAISTPLQVLKHFLRHYSGFDWEKHCLTLQGSQQLSMYPYWDDESSEDTDVYLISPRYMHEVTKCYAYSMHTSCKEFQMRSMNILDPLVPYNNIGRSISQANAHRVRSAFRLGWERLERVLAQQLNERTADAELKKFFHSTWRLNSELLDPFDQKDRKSPYETAYGKLSRMESSTPSASLVGSPVDSPMRHAVSSPFGRSPPQSSQAITGNSKSRSLPSGQDFGKELAKWAMGVCSRGVLGIERTLEGENADSKMASDVKSPGRQRGTRQRAFSTSSGASTPGGLNSLSAGRFGELLGKSSLENLNGMGSARLNSLMEDAQHAYNLMCSTNPYHVRARSFSSDGALVSEASAERRAEQMITIHMNNVNKAMSKTMQSQSLHKHPGKKGRAAKRSPPRAEGGKGVSLLSESLTKGAGSATGSSSGDSVSR